MRKIILASSSPRRKEILSKSSLPFEIIPSQYEEDMTLAMEPDELAKHLSSGKAEDVAKKATDAIVIGADTFLTVDGHILGKPHTEAKAKEMLQLLSGSTHSVFTGYTIIDTKSKKKISKAVETVVYFKSLSEQEIEGYINTGEPLELAGAYAIQNMGSMFVKKIDGDYSNIMGFPLFNIVEDLKEFGISCWEK